MDAPTTFHGAYERGRVSAGALAYVDHGTGEPIVFVHGGLSDVSYLEPIVATFAGQFRAISYSRRYAWPNPPLPEGAADPIEAQLATMS